MNQWRSQQSQYKKLERNKVGAKLACIWVIISLRRRGSVWFRSKRDRGRGFSVLIAREIKRDPKKWKWLEGERKKGNACGKKPLDFEKSEGSAWLARLVEQHWDVSIKGLLHTERSYMVSDSHLNFLQLLFTLVGKTYPPWQEHFL